MKNFRLLVALSLVWAMERGNASSCTGSGPFACFRYGKSGEWKSFQPKDRNVFVSLDDFDGQYVPKNEQDFLEILNKNVALILGQMQDKKNYSIFVDATESDKRMFQLSSIDSVIVGDIGVVNSKIKLNAKRREIIKLSFDGKSSILLEALEKNGRTGVLRMPSSLTYLTNQKWSLIGKVVNKSAQNVDLDFKNGARMFGDLYTSSISHTDIVFDGLYTPKGGGNIFDRVVFYGGIFADNGGNRIVVKEGDVKAESNGSGGYGILAKNGGANVIYFGGGGRVSSYPQDLNAFKISSIAKSYLSNTENEIIFRNGVENNILYTTSIEASNGRNTILAMEPVNNQKTSLKIGIREAIISKGEHPEGGNLIKIIGKLEVDQVTVLQNNVFGIIALGGTNEICIGLPDAEGNAKFPKVYSYGHGKNFLKVFGNLTFSYFVDSINKKIFGGEIVAENGGENILQSSGNFFVEEKRQILPESIVQKAETRQIDAKKIKILALGGDKKGKNSAIFVVTNDKDFSFGEILSYGGSNEIIFFGKQESFSLALLESGGGVRT